MVATRGFSSLNWRRMLSGASTVNVTVSGNSSTIATSVDWLITSRGIVISASVFGLAEVTAEVQITKANKRDRIRDVRLLPNHRMSLIQIFLEIW
jgi:hypothetical protein